MNGFTPTFSASLGILSIIVASWLNKNTRMGFKDILDALALGGRNMVTTGVILLCSGIVVGVVLMVGMGIKFSMMISALAAGSIFITIVLIALASLVLGMGLPVTASYIVLAVLAAPSLVGLMLTGYLISDMGMTAEVLKDPNVLQSMIALVPQEVSQNALLAAHLLIFWYSQDANVTPPVCLAAYSASGIAGSKPLETGFESWKLAKGLYIIPIMFIYRPEILFQGPLWMSIVSISLVTLGLFVFAAFFEGYYIKELSWPLRIVMVAIAMALFWPNLIFGAAGLGAFVMITLMLKATKAKSPILAES
jgi:TRAP-type uncharacterized transport system fused permease subunit